MRYRLRRLMIVLAIGPLLVLARATCTGQPPNTPGAKSPVLYSSPTAVFNAYQDAHSQRDWRKCFQCLTSDAQADLIFETYFACGMSGSSEVAAMCKKYIGDPDTFHKD